MSEVKLFLNGIYPRSEALVRASQNHDRGRISDAEWQAQFRVDRERLFQLQHAARVDYFCDGMLNWQDLFRPFIETGSGLKAGALVRFFENNTFYRQPVVTGPLRFDAGRLDDYFTQDDTQRLWKAVMPSPYSFSRLAVDEHYKELDRLMLEYAQALRGVIEHLVKRGYSFIQLSEPYLAYHGASEVQLKALGKALEMLTANLKAKVGLHLYFGSTCPIERLLELPVTALGFDFLYTDADALGRQVFSKELMCGCVDGRNSLVEDPEMSVNLARRLLETKPSVLYLTTNTDLEYLPEPVARRKVELLGQVASRLRGK